MQKGLKQRFIELVLLATLSLLLANVAYSSESKSKISILNPDRDLLAANFLTKKAIVLLENKKYDEALVEFDRAIIIFPTARAHRMRGAIRMKLGDTPGALSDFGMCIELEPDIATHYISRALILQLTNNYEAAIEDYVQALKIDPRSPRWWGNLGLARMQVGELAQAELDLSEALKIWPTYPEGLYNRGVARHKQLNFIGAIDDYQKALEIKPNWKDVLHNLSLAKNEVDFNNQADTN